MALAYITGGQYVPMVDAQLLAKIIIGGVREEMSLDRLMQNALPDIDCEMNKAESEGIDEKAQAKRVRDIFSSKNICLKRMRNSHGAFSSAATDGYAKCPDMAEMRIQFRLQSEATPTVSTTSRHTGSASETDYDLLDDEVVITGESNDEFQVNNNYTDGKVL
ncbi:unnamed protein product [Rotaria sp. Silwood1]|nr:unnamed protein product [Rotaria sp. Silwood1]